MHSGYESAVDLRSERSDDVYKLRYDGRDKARAGSRTRVVATRHTSATRGYCGRIGGMATTDRPPDHEEAARPRGERHGRSHLVDVEVIDAQIH